MDILRMGLAALSRMWAQMQAQGGVVAEPDKVDAAQGNRQADHGPGTRLSLDAGKRFSMLGSLKTLITLGMRRTGLPS
jgi:hypothetical protein